MKQVLEKGKKSTRTEEQSEEFQLISPRLEAFLTSDANSAAPSPNKKKSVPSRGPSAAKRTKQPVKLIAADLESNDDDGIALDEDEVKAILAKGFVCFCYGISLFISKQN